jgi:hypothetical protein
MGKAQALSVNGLLMPTAFPRSPFEATYRAAGVGEIAKVTGLSPQAIYRIKADPAAAEAVLASWAG